LTDDGDQVLELGWFWDTEIMVRAHFAGLRIIEIPAPFERCKGNAPRQKPRATKEFEARLRVLEPRNCHRSQAGAFHHQALSVSLPQLAHLIGCPVTFALNSTENRLRVLMVDYPFIAESTLTACLRKQDHLYSTRTTQWGQSQVPEPSSHPYTSRDYHLSKISRDLISYNVRSLF
jgi:hypothetical protein